MKRITQLIIFLLATSFAFAQSPLGFKYQGVARNNSDMVIANDFISIRIAVLRGSSSGNLAYRETHAGIPTNDLGVFTLTIGEGDVLSGDFSTIDWGNDSYFVRVDLDPQGGSNYVQMGTSQLLSVPYALHSNTAGFADTAGSGGGGDDDWGNQTVQTNNTLLGDGTSADLLRVDVSQVNTDNQNLNFDSGTNELSISGGNSVTIPTGGTDADADPTNELQKLIAAKVGDDEIRLTITEGGSDTDAFDVEVFNVRDGDSNDRNELQDLSHSTSGSNNVTIDISDGTGTTFSVEDDDSDPGNELQELFLTGNFFDGNELSISLGNTVTIPSLWMMNQFGSIHYPTEVSVGTDQVFGEFTVNGRGFFLNTANQTARSVIHPDGRIELIGSNGRNITLGNSIGDYGKIELFNNDNSIILMDRTSAGGGYIGLTNQFGFNQTVKLFTRDDDGAGQIETYAAQSLNTYSGHTSGLPQAGAMAVANDQGSFKAGLLVDAQGMGVTFADIKNFRMDYPGRSNKEIWYASLEGPEAGAYERGTATLVDGEATIPFSDHFSKVIIEEGMTVMLTPLSGESLGLAVIEKTRNGFKVIELHGGKGNYSFDWEAKGVRVGFKDYKVVRNKEALIEVQQK